MQDGPYKDVPQISLFEGVLNFQQIECKWTKKESENQHYKLGYKFDAPLRNDITNLPSDGHLGKGYLISKNS